MATKAYAAPDFETRDVRSGSGMAVPSTQIPFDPEDTGEWD